MFTNLSSQIFNITYRIEVIIRITIVKFIYIQLAIFDKANSMTSS